MFHPEFLAAAIHADRLRQLEIAARNRRLLERPDDAVAEVTPTGMRTGRSGVLPPRMAKPGATGSACEPA